MAFPRLRDMASDLMTVEPRLLDIAGRIAVDFRVTDRAVIVVILVCNQALAEDWPELSDLGDPQFDACVRPAQMRAFGHALWPTLAI